MPVNKEQRIVLNLQSNAGTAALSFSLAVGIIGSLLVSQTDSDSRNAVELTKKLMTAENLQQANEEALNLASQLIGTGVIGLRNQKGSLQFSSDTQVDLKVKNGDEAVSEDKANKFSLNLKKDSSTFQFSDKGDWLVENGSIIVYGCIVHKVSPGKTDEIFNRENDDGLFWTNSRNHCKSMGKAIPVTTRISPTKSVPDIIANPKALADLTHIQVATQSSGNDQIFKANAVLKLPKASHQCDGIYGEKAADIEGFWGTEHYLKACKTDHCPFMQPVTVNGAPQYHKDGKVKLMPNPNYLDNISGRINLRRYHLEQGNDINPAEIQPEALYKFYHEALVPGLKNPFLEPRRLGGRYQQTANAEFENVDPATSDADLTVRAAAQGGSLDGPQMVGTSADPAGNDQSTFEGWLIHKTGKIQSAGSTAAPEWPEGISYDDPNMRKALLNGCRRSLIFDHDDSTAYKMIDQEQIDFCAKIRYPLFRIEYQYDNLARTCRYYGPNLQDNRLAFIKNSSYLTTTLNSERLNPWNTNYPEGISVGPASSFTFDPASAAAIDLTEHDQSAVQHFSGKFSVGEIYFVATDTKTYYKDQGSHEELGPDGITIIKVEYTYDGSQHIAKFGPDLSVTVPLPEVFAGSDSFVKYTLEKNTGGILKIKREKVALTWNAECQDYNTTHELIVRNEQSYAHEQDLCFYITYHNVEDRNDCRREISYIACRTTNGCFTGDTLITMADGSQKPISKITKIDKILNPITGKAMGITQKYVGDEHKALYKFTFSDKVHPSITVTDNHPMLVGGVVKRADGIKIGDALNDRHGNLRQVSAIDLVKNDHAVSVWNLLLANEDGSVTQRYEDHFLIANGLMTGDWFIQNNKYPKDEYEKFTAFLNDKLKK
jgi:hypothetical protein